MNTSTEEITAVVATDAAGHAGADLWNNVSGSVIERFIDFIWVKHGLSAPTLHAYRADLHALDRWLLILKRKTVVQANAGDIREFLVERAQRTQESGASMPSLACIKRFYRFLVDGGFREDDPTESVFVRAPRLVKHDLTVVSSTTESDPRSPATASDS